MSYIFAHMGYENALWELDKLPSFLQTDEVSVRTIVQRHNLVCGELLATLERDMRISAESSPRSWGCFQLMAGAPDEA